MAKTSTPNKTAAPEETPYWSVELGNMSVSVYEVGDHYDVKWNVSEDRCEVIGGTLRKLDVDGYVQFLQDITPPGADVQPATLSKIASDCPVDLSLASSTLDSEPFIVVSDLNYNITPEELGFALRRAVQSGAKLNKSVDKLVKTFRHYVERDQSEVDTVIDLITIKPGDGKATHRANPKRIASTNTTTENANGDINWFDINTRIPHGTLSERDISDLVKIHVPKHAMAEEFKILSLRGFSLNPEQPERVIRNKILILVGERSLITLHEGPIDNIGIHGSSDSITEFKDIILGARKAHMDLFVNSPDSMPLMGPGALFLDFCTILFRQQEHVMKRYQDLLDNAKYDTEHPKGEKVAFTIDTGDAREAVDYMERRIDDASQRIQALCSARKTKALKCIFGKLDDSAVETAERYLQASVSRMKNFCSSAEDKISFLENHEEDSLVKERERRAYGLTVVGTLVLPALAAVELAQVPWQPIVNNPDKILMGGGFASVLCTIGFMLYDRYRRKVIGTE